jgi:2-polyprenyl-3-methyl-5-hydroxy-6-metoxy-1,4-benzoquinol methylase
MNVNNYLKAHIIQLKDSDINNACTEVRSIMREKFTQELIDKRITVNDWARWSIILDLVKNTSSSILDIGIAHGTFINALSRVNAAERLVGIDIKEYSLYSEIFPGFERIIADADSMPFRDGEFETVTCMEVIEHLPGEKMQNVISNLRRVAAKRLIISIPFCEPLPLPKWHHQQFTVERVSKLFPDAQYTLMLKSPVTRVHWLLIDESQE